MTTEQRLFTVDPWKVSLQTWDKDTRRLQESMTSIGNGYMGMRGNFEEGFSGDHHNGTYIAGVWYPDKTRVGWWKNGYPEYFGKVINAVNFAAMEIYVNNERVELGTVEPESFDLSLDMKKGILSRSFTASVAGVKATFSFERFLSITQQQIAAFRLNVSILEGEGTIKIVSKLDGNVTNEDSNYGEMFWSEVARGVEGSYSYLTTRTIPNPFGIEQFTVTAAMDNRTSVAGVKADGPYLVEETFEYDVTVGSEVSLDKLVAVVTSRDIEEISQVNVAASHLDGLPTYEALRTSHEEAWADRWKLADVVIEGDDAAQQGIRFNLFQLFSTYYGEDERLNIGPKGFTGEKYGGATYWDTEAYAVPLYLALADPSVTRNLLKYRHNQLPGAIHNAQQQGLKGALYPMVTFTGVECHNEWEITFMEIHRNGAIPYAIYNYTNYTGDDSYLKNEGLEVLLEVSRFWADRVHFSEHAGKYMMHGVTGPNEYENNVNNNWYTNTIAAWVLRYTKEMYEKYQDEATIQIEQAELDQWTHIVDNMYYPFDEERNVFIQHDTFLDKDLMPVTELDPANLPLNQKWSWDRILRSCFIKQADVLQGIYFFGDQYSEEEKRRNFEFYEPMTVHESSLSPSIHAILAAELGMEDKAVEMYQRTARLDLDNYNNDTEDGLHITSTTGSWLAIVQGFAQMKTWNETLSFAPFVPQSWNSYSFHINYRGRLLLITANKQNTTIELLEGEPLELTLYGTEYRLEDVLSVDIKN